MLDQQSHHKNGFSAVEFMTMLGILSIVISGVISLNVTLRKQIRQTAEVSQMDVIRRNIAAVALDPSSWKKTLEYNSKTGPGAQGKFRGEMDCLLNGSSCLKGSQPITNQPFALVDATGTVIFDATKESNGLTADAKECQSFPVHGKSAQNLPTSSLANKLQTEQPGCIARYNLTWSAQCAGSSPCLNPLVRISAQLQLADPKTPVNTEKLSIPSLVRAPQ